MTNIYGVFEFLKREASQPQPVKGQVKMDAKSIKPSKEIFGGELIVVRKNQINYQIKALSLPESRVGAKLLDEYRKDVTPKEEFEKTDLLKYAKDYYRKKGIGRPTKKDRRDIDDYQEETTEDI